MFVWLGLVLLGLSSYLYRRRRRCKNRKTVIGSVRHISYSDLNIVCNAFGMHWGLLIADSLLLELW
jgi:hypothetical protein